MEDTIDSIFNNDSWDLHFNYTKLPNIYEMNITSTLLPLSQVQQNVDFSDSEDPVIIADGIREVYQTLDCALNSTSSNRRNAKAGVRDVEPLNSRFEEIATTSQCCQEDYH